MPDAPAPADTATTTTTATPWYQGHADAEIIGHWQNRNIDLADPGKVAVEMTKAYRELEKFRGVPAARLVTLPENLNDPAALRPVYERLGAPKDAKDYDFNLKYTDGDPFEPALADYLRPVFHARGVPKDAALEITKAIMKEAETRGASEALEVEARKSEQIARLDQLWGPKKNENMLTAMNGARRAGFTPEDVKAMEQAIGIDKVGEFFRKLGASTNEATFVEGAKAAGSPATAEMAIARMNELKTDPEWRARYLKGSQKEVTEWNNLMAQRTGIIEAAELASL